jgi:hypothetical protein
MQELEYLSCAAVLIGIYILAGTQRCFNIEITLKYDRDVVQLIFKYGRPYGYIANVYSMLIQRCLWSKLIFSLIII